MVVGMQAFASYREVTAENHATSNRESQKTRICLQGALDAHTAGDIRALFDAVLADHPREVIIDLYFVELIDSTGANALVTLYKRVTSQGGKMRVEHAHDQPLAVLELLKLDRVFGL
jgi:anti-anti-sigma factor